MQTTTEQGTLRITTFGNRTIMVVDCTNAGKRGKVCLELTIQTWAAGQVENGQLFCDLVHNMSLKLEDLKTWDDAMRFQSLAQALRSDSRNVQICTHEHKGIRVAPLGFQAVSVGNDNYSAGVSYEDFSASDKVDQANCPKWISTSKQRKADFAKVYAFVRNNQASLNAPEVTFHAFIKMVSEATGVSGHYYCAMD